MRRSIYLLFLVVGGFIQAQQPEQHSVNGRTNQPSQLQKPYVILISADGFRYDYADKYGATHLQKLRKAGVQAQSMIPSFPSVTFPNHYTVATGLYPSHHGIVYNLFYDRQRKQTYNMGDRKTVEDGTWYGGIPLWVLAEQQGLLAASYFFVGSEAAIQNTYPTYWYTYNDKIPVDTRIAQVVEWLQLPPETRPHLITFYFSQVDHEGHSFGPDATQTRDAVKEVDEAIGKLTKAVEALHLPVNYIFLADHGMAAVDTVTRMDLTPLIDTSLYWVRGGTTQVNIYAKPGVSTDTLRADLKSVVPKFDLYRKEE
ncbi:MAG: ectonucleotide pyrophosphatase/phosphodiesterase, partial [Chitinophagaceae bacterium]